MRIHFCIITIYLVFSTIQSSSAQPVNLDSIDLFIEHQMEKYHIPGIAACVIKGDKLEWSRAYGYANIESELKMSNQSILNIGSISKTITATAVMQLWEKEVLHLDGDINQYLDFTVRNPNFPDVPITIKQLLTHTSSIADGSAYKIGYDCGDPKKSLDVWLSNYFRVDGEYYNAIENFHNNPPDSFSSYSNIAYGLLGLIVEKVSGLDFRNYVKQNIFDPLKMDDSGYFLKEIDSTNLATSYLYLGPLQKGIEKTESNVLPYFNPYCHYGFWNYPDGLVRTSTDDLAKFAIAYMNNGLYQDKRMLEAETINRMMTPQLSETVNEDMDQGLCWFQSSSLHPSWYHSGSDPGVSTRLYINKEDKIGIIVIQNVNQNNSFNIVQELYNRFKN